MSAELAELLQKLPLYLGGHVTLSLAALALGLLVSLPLGIAASRRPRLAEWLLGAAGIIQTVPSLALLALMVPLLGRPDRFLARAARAGALQHPAHPGEHDRRHSGRGPGLDRGRARLGHEPCARCSGASSCRWPLRSFSAGSARPRSWWSAW